MSLLDRIHEQYDADGDPVLFECDECGHRTQSLGGLHAHVEQHRGYTRFGIQIPFTKTSMGRRDELMKRTNVLRVTETEEISLDDVEGF